MYSRSSSDGQLTWFRDYKWVSGGGSQLFTPTPLRAQNVQRQGAEGSTRRECVNHQLLERENSLAPGQTASHIITIFLLQNCLSFIPTVMYENIDFTCTAPCRPQNHCLCTGELYYVCVCVSWVKLEGWGVGGDVDVRVCMHKPPAPLK